MPKIAFKPIIDTHTEILILGSMPGEQSLVKQEYYANNRNQFWNIIAGVFGWDKPLITYQNKIDLLKSNKIGLWDVFESCEREGSLDVNIKNGVLNDFETLFKRYPKIRLILFNGGASYKSFKKQIDVLDDITYLMMPSTSPAHTMAYGSKLDAWRKGLTSS
jgi:hypoxanthine-DNA glycosylase